MKVQLHVTLVDMEQCHRAGLHFAPFVFSSAGFQKKVLVWVKVKQRLLCLMAVQYPAVQKVVWKLCPQLQQNIAREFVIDLFQSDAPVAT